MIKKFKNLLCLLLSVTFVLSSVSIALADDVVSDISENIVEEAIVDDEISEDVVIDQSEEVVIEEVEETDVIVEDTVIEAEEVAIDENQLLSNYSEDDIMSIISDIANNIDVNTATEGRTDVDYNEELGNYSTTANENNSQEDVYIDSTNLLATYYNGTFVPTYTSITGISQKGTGYLDSGAKVYKYNYIDSKYPASYLAYITVYEGFVEADEQVADDSSYVIYSFVSSRDFVIVSINFALSEVWVVPQSLGSTTTEPTTETTTKTPSSSSERPAPPSFAVKGVFGGRDVTFNCATPNAKIYYTTRNTSNVSTSLDPGVTPGTTVRFSNYYGTIYAKAYANGKWSNVARLILKIPTINTPTITRLSANNYKIRTTTPSCIVYYTTNGTTPSATNYAGKFWTSHNVRIPDGKTIKAIAVRSCFTDSQVATYTPSASITPSTPSTSVSNGVTVPSGNITLTYNNGSYSSKFTGTVSCRIESTNIGKYKLTYILNGTKSGPGSNCFYEIKCYDSAGYLLDTKTKSVKSSGSTSEFTYIPTSTKVVKFENT